MGKTVPRPDRDFLSSDIRNCTSGDGQKCTTRLVVGSRFEIRREA
jgi:hypothetical protein